MIDPVGLFRKIRQGLWLQFVRSHRLDGMNGVVLEGGFVLVKFCARKTERVKLRPCIW